jgi:hypothetical protein
MTSLLMGLAVVAAVLAVGVRRFQKTRTARRRPGATIYRAVLVRRFDEIDAALRDRACMCGGALRVVGETSRAAGGRRFRIARLVCNECERDELMHFDVTAVFH